MYRIELEGGGVPLASNLTREDLDNWWSKNGNQYFGIRSNGETIIVREARHGRIGRHEYAEAVKRQM